MINLLKKIIILSSTVILFACGSGNQGPGSANTDNTPPTVLKVSPSSLPNQKILPVDAKTISIQFSKPVAQSTLDALNAMTIKSGDQILAGTWSFGATNDVIIFTLANTPIIANGQFTIDLNGKIKDVAGNVLTNSPLISFRTGAVYKISVDAKGLEGDETVTIKENSSNSSLTLSATQLSGDIPEMLDNGSYSLSISAQPKNKFCVLSSSTVSINGTNATAAITCQEVIPYYSDAPLWNDYHTISPDQLSVHGGERRAVNVNGVNSCDNITATDALSAFSWTCEEEKTNNTVTAVKVVSTGLKPGKGLSDLIDFNQTPPTWKKNSVTISGQISKTTTPAIWWNNPVLQASTNNYQLTSPNTIYVVTDQPIQRPHFDIQAKGISLVVNPKITLLTQNGGVNVTSSGANFWIEGNFNAQLNDSGITLSNTYYGRLNNVKVSNASGNGITVNNCKQGIKLNNVTSVRNAGSGIAINNNTNNIYPGAGVMVSNSNFSNNSASGVALNAPYTNLINVIASSNQKYGFVVNTAYNVLSQIFANNNKESGILINGVHNNLLSSITAANNDAYGISLVSNNGNMPTFNNIYIATLANNKIGAINGGTFSDVQLGDILSAYNTDNTICSSCDNVLSIASSDMLMDTLFNSVNSDTNVSSYSTNQSIPASSLPNYPTLDSPFRSWGSSTLPSTDTATGSCLADTNDKCKIYDWRLKSGAKAAIGAINSPTKTLTFDFKGTPATAITYLENALEINSDNIGNNNGFCEAGETCVLVSNNGSYQGQGDLSDVTNTEASALNITLKQYSINGN